MHSQGMIHGDLKGVRLQPLAIALPSNSPLIKVNILIDQNGHARLADFGLLTIVSDPTDFATSSPFVISGTTRWMSPELLDPDQLGLENSRPTKESDCYALGMVIYEVLSGQAPFTPFKHFVVVRKVLDGERPGRPDGPEGTWFTDDLWQMLEMCWETQPEARPNVQAVLEHLELVSGAWKPPSPQADEGIDVDEDDWDLTTVSDSSGMVLRFDHPRFVFLRWIPY